MAKWLTARTSGLVVQVQALPLGSFQGQKTLLHFVSFHILCWEPCDNYLLKRGVGGGGAHF